MHVADRRHATLSLILELMTTPLKRTAYGVLIFFAILIVGLVACDIAGWTFLREPMAKFLTSTMGRQVRIDAPFELHFRKSIRLKVGGLHIDAPAWSKRPHFVEGRQLYVDLAWSAIFGKPVHLYRVEGESLSVYAERQATGEASWDFAQNKEKKSESAGVPAIDELVLTEGKVRVDDAIAAIALDVNVTTREGAAVTDAASVITGKGTWRKHPLGFNIQAPGLMAVASGKAVADLKAKIDAGPTHLSFDGKVTDVTAWTQFEGNFHLSGKSLGDLSEIPGVTLPSTPPYDLKGRVDRDNKLIKIDVSQARIGSSDLSGKFEYDGRLPVPKLSGTLGGKRLALLDLGPSVGAGGADSQAGNTASANEKKGAKARGGAKPGANAKAGRGSPSVAKKGTKSDPAQTTTASNGGDAPNSNRVLPDKEFDIPSLKAMDADVGVAIDEFSPGTQVLQSIRNLRANIQLSGGTLKVSSLKGDIAGGSMSGDLAYDASAEGRPPRWDAKLKWTSIDLRQFLRQTEGKYLVLGRFSGAADVTGAGKSTGAILGDLSGTIRAAVANGQLSHTLVELAGLDIAQALGVFVKGDELLPMQCAAFQFDAAKGVLTTRTGVIDTTDTTFLLDGNIGLRDEKLSLVLVQEPKDWSPFSLRSPITVRGSLGSPSVGVEPKPLAIKAAAALALGVINPLAAILPFFEFGEDKPTAGCQQTVERLKGQTLPRPAGAGRPVAPAR